LKFCIHKPSLGSFAVAHNLWARSVQPFGRLLDKKNSDKFLLLRCVGNVGVNLELQADKQRSILQTEESIKQLQSEKWQLELEVGFKFIRDRISLI